MIDQLSLCLLMFSVHFSLHFPFHARSRSRCCFCRCNFPGPKQLPRRFLFYASVDRLLKSSRNGVERFMFDFSHQSNDYFPSPLPIQSFIRPVPSLPVYAGCRSMHCPPSTLRCPATSEFESESPL